METGVRQVDASRPRYEHAFEAGRFLRKLRKKYRAELPQVERDRLVAEWERLVGKEDKPRQLDEVSRGGRGNKDGNAEAARQLGLSRQDVERAIVGIWWASGGQALFLPGKIVSQKIA